MKRLSFSEILREEPSFRLKQIKKSFYQDLVSNWNEATTLPKELREKLNQEVPLEIDAEDLISKDKKTVKSKIILDDGLKIETVLLSHKNKRNTVCVSSQVGCALGCEFCATGQMGFKRDLGADEIIAQVLYFARKLKERNRKITNVVFMGMGEPFLNYENVINSIKVLNDPKGFNLGMRRFSISTSGITEGIRKLTDENMEVNLAISLHAPNNKLRSELMPISREYSLDKVLTAVDEYIEKTNRKVMFEYVMLDDINDHLKETEELAGLMKKPLYMVNLISYNPTQKYKPSPSWRIEKFQAILEKKGVKVTRRYSFGQEVKGACGQLAENKKTSN